MATMNISVPTPMKDWVLSQIEGGRYISASDYVRDLIRKDRGEKDKIAALQAAITLGIESGEAGDLDMEAVKKRARKLAGLDSL